MENVPLAGRQAENIIDLIRAEVVMGVFAVYVMIVDIVSTHKEVAPLYTPIEFE